MDALNRRAMLTAAAVAALAPIPAVSMAQPALAPAAFIADLIRADLTVLASPSGKLELLAFRTRLDREGNGYEEVPRHPDADLMAARFYALTESESAGIAAYVLALPGTGRGHQ